MKEENKLSEFIKAVTKTFKDELDRQVRLELMWSYHPFAKGHNLSAVDSFHWAIIPIIMKNLFILIIKLIIGQ